MKKLLAFMLFCSFFAILMGMSVYAKSNVAIDTDNTKNGIVTIKMVDIDLKKKIYKVRVEKGSDKYDYTLILPSTNLPLQMGTGEYKVTVMENVSGNSYKPLESKTFQVTSIDEAEMYKASIPMIEYSVAENAVPAFRKLTEDKKTVNDIISILYDTIARNYSYDTAKAMNPPAGYVPVVDEIYASKKGICYDYSSLLGSALRSQGIPTRLVMGYAAGLDEYHAWNEILIDGKWVAVDATYDAQVIKAGKKYTMAKDKDKRQVVKIY